MVINPLGERNSSGHDLPPIVGNIKINLMLYIVASSTKLIIITSKLRSEPRETQYPNRIKKNVFLTLNDAAKVRDSRTKLSLIAQEYINLAYEMGGDSWYGAEEVWGTDAFKNRVNELHEDDGQLSLNRRLQNF